VIVYTAVFGNTDPLCEPAVKTDVRMVCFTDQPIKSSRWEIVRLPVSEAPKRESRRYKQPSHRIFPDADLTLWIDCCYTLLMDPREIAARNPGLITAFRHHRRDRIKDEAEVIIRSGKGKRDAIMAQLAAYQSDGWDTDANPQRAIHCGGFLLRRHTPEVRAFNEAWHHEVQTRTLRDQMSIDYVASKTGVKIDRFTGTCRSNPYARLAVIPRKPTNDF
jgi:hypothetical protein